MAIHVVVLEAYDKIGAQNVTLYFSTEKFNTKSTDTPANTHFRPRIKRPAKIKRSMFAPGKTSGKSQVGFGNLILENGDGGLDFLEDYAFDGRSITQYKGEVDAAFPAGFKKTIVATAEQAIPNRKTYQVKIKDRQDEVDIPLQPTKYAGSNALPAGLEGVAGDLKGKPKPLCYGVVKGIAPPLVNTSKLIYQLHDGVLDSVDEVYDSGIILSKTSRHWDQVASTPISTALHGVAFADGIWVAVGFDSGLITSTDLVTWTSRTDQFGALEDILDVAYSPDLDLWVIVGTNNKISTSPDGITWTARTSPFAGGTVIFSVSWGNGVFVIAGGGTASSNQLATSANGTSWTSRTSQFTNGETARSSVFARGLFVVGGGTNSGKIQTSPDGTTWTLRESGLDNTITILGIAFGRGLFVAGGLSAASATNIVVSTSPDGIIWTSREIRDMTFEDIQYSEFLGLFIAAGLNVVGYDHAILSSVNGAEWEISKAGFGTSGVNDIGVGNDTVVVVGEDGKIAILTTDPDYASEAALLDDDNIPQPGTYLSYLTGGYIRLGSPPAGLITADATEGANAAARTGGQIFTDILEQAGLSSGDWSASDITALDSARSEVLGYWAGLTDVPASSPLNKIAESLGAWWGLDNVGIFRIKELLSPGGESSILTITQNDMVQFLRRIAPRESGGGVPNYRSTVKYHRRYTVQTEGLAFGVTDVRRAELAEEWRKEVNTDSGVQTAHLLSREKIYETLLDTEAHATSAANRFQTLRGVKRSIYEFSVAHTDDTEDLDLGDIITIEHERWGLSSGKKCAILFFEAQPDRDTILLGVWG